MAKYVLDAQLFLRRVVPSRSENVENGDVCRDSASSPHQEQGCIKQKRLSSFLPP